MKSRLNHVLSADKPGNFIWHEHAPICRDHPIDLNSGETKINEDYPILKSFLAGSFSGTFSTILFQPLDLVKTRLQSRINAPVGSPKNGMLGMVAHIVQKENIFGLWKGMTPSITRVIPGVGLYFSSLHWLKHTFNLEEPLTALQAISLGITARSMSGALLIPITVVKTRFESGVYKYNSISEALTLIYKQEGIRGLSSGLVPTLLRDAPYSGLYLMFYTQLKNAAANTGATNNSSTSIHFSCGILAGILASIVTQPPDVIKTKMQLYPNEFHGICHATFFIYKKYGILGYFKGIIPRMLRRTLMTTMAWTVYEQVTRQIGLK
ncbi:PREDICTED: solute carrier family 25 member 38-like isoform X1 [Acromyrmex echinatior]|uniref:solute carrier family 25 member 38-like isoform X1 n=1 Tax=Acromyrmex echinatior TaxID=103372 RepID=UPI000580D681|nr:PREDICTED: solute carrier family 25 member 38-like isoform X1 [Acromyrmex echinatior]XP_011066156.1 PREDICTED: solute carrier family 25 member 38-like isoform X1 [Acromyrmex echinatior]XP_011066157.1 PREDICTED: solute carrier family 25 member 38-like isoform X1 [Acromyrmex echinatior]XP_011066158.1 PREDICTED: solute carrier family 25 member 38-like isoform X1 [Acromyrmex echinatior]XP_011066159.1 PREDICTED: solute carrier family 25 member 38-like isoform X1 [Acromyrmex echinatior]